MGKKLVSITGLAMILAIVLAVNLIGAVLMGNLKFDVTQEKLFTLSDGARSILSSLPDNIAAKFYYSKTAMADAPLLKPYAARVLEMLREFQSASGGKFALEVLDPRPDTETEEWADRYGLQGLPTNTGERVFLGLVLKDESGNEQTVPFFHPDREPTLEYDLAKAVYSMSRPERKRVGVLSSLNVMGDERPPNPMMMQPPQQRPWTFIRGLRQTFKVEGIAADAAEIPTGLDLLLIVHPKNLSDAARYAIDQYVLRGGKVLAFVDPLCRADQESLPDQPQLRMQTPVSSNMPDLLAAWGLELEGAEQKSGPAGFGGESGGKVVADPSNAYQNPQTGDNVIVLLTLGEKNRNTDEIITNELENIWMFCAGGLKKINTSDDLKIVPLLETSEKASLMDGFMLKFGVDPAQLTKDFKPGNAKIALAWKITGKFKTAFPDGKPSGNKEGEEAEGAKQEKPAEDPNQLKESKEPGTVIVVGDVDMISDQFSVQISRVFGREFATAINDNQAFLNNAIENLTGSSDLIGLRSRGRSQRPFTKVREIETAAQAQWLEKEKALDQKLQEANNRLSEIQKGTQERRILDAAYAKEIEKLREERRTTQRELRDVRRRLRENVESLAIKVKMINIALLPLVVVLVGVGIGTFRSLRKRKA